ncbi:MAG: transglycosylase SLT domain-containing protein [Spirochaetes bacterium]|nr:transglycosylase SLT domain-containing protein [Spirochaetota bacterium]
MIKLSKIFCVLFFILLVSCVGTHAQISGDPDNKDAAIPVSETDGDSGNESCSLDDPSEDGDEQGESTDMDSQGITEEPSGIPSDEYFYSLPSLENKELFQSISDLSICNLEDVRNYISQYLNRARPFTINAFKRCGGYYAIVLEIFNEHKIPLELSFLPLLESGFNPYAVSRSKATGMWQFMRSTARELGLKSNEWVEERRDIEKSTLAAIMHLKNLYCIFGSWELALASYNGGAGYIKKAMKKTGTSSFEELLKSGYLKMETCQFVHRYAALTVIYLNQERFGIKKDIPESLEIRTVNIILKSSVNLKETSRLLGADMETLRMYNPELKRNITPPYERNYTLRIPESSLAAFGKHESKLYANKYKHVKRHIVQKGENLSRIADMYNIKTRTLIEFNDIKNPSLIQPGQSIYIPI